VRSYYSNSYMLDGDKLASDTIINFFAENNLMSVPENIYEGFDTYRSYIYENYNHGQYYTSVQPEDERLAYAVSKIVKPKSAFIAGSYYGYFAIWLMPHIAENNGLCILSDIDQRVCRLAKNNFDKLGYANNAQIMCEDAVKLLNARKEPLDFILIDALGSWNDPRPDYRGKQIYIPILKAACASLTKGSTILMHNVRPRDFDQRYSMNKNSMLSILKSIDAVGICYDSRNGLGVFVVT